MLAHVLQNEIQHYAGVFASRERQIDSRKVVKYELDTFASSLVNIFAFVISSHAAFLRRVNDLVFFSALNPSSLSRSIRPLSLVEATCGKSGWFSLRYCLRIFTSVSAEYCLSRYCSRT